MASKVCLNCRTSLPGDAAVCHRCSGRNFGPPKAPPFQNWLLIAGGIFFVAVIAAGAVKTDKAHDAEPTPVSAVSSAEAASAAESSAIPQDRLNDAQFLDEKYDTKAVIACGSGADDYLRSIAKYDFDWDESAKGFMGVKFGKFMKVVDSPGVLVMVSDSAKLQNGFGAFKHIKLDCLYDTQQDKVLEYQASE